jgi:hypothetical protein
LCQTSRPRGAKRCACNYTFEYEAPPRHSFGRLRRSTASLDVIVLIVAVGAGMIAGLLTNGIDRRTLPDGAVLWGLIAIGVFAVAGGAFGWRWFLSSSRARWPRLLFGTDGARVFYGVVGGALAGGGIALVLV